ncbi:Cytochrome c oxidase assembly protein cox11, mitochondrial [Serendipita sp. 398]|nr:Cytochrome c oxidase assembly protein cox11, mitochondrial [Serendipita sp. 398]
MLGHSAFSNNLGSRRILVQAIRSSSPRCSNGRIKQRPKPNVNLTQRSIHAGPICSNINDRRPFDPIEAAKARYSQRNRSLLMYSTATILVALGLSYAAVPLYRAFCAATGFGGTPQTGTGKFDPERLHAISGARPIKVTFNSATSEALPWKFTPQQKHVWVLPGETSLAFYTAKNNSKEDVIGIATYNVIPDRVSIGYRVFTTFLSFVIRSHHILQKSNAFASKSKDCWPEKRLICHYFSLLIRISWKTPVPET